MSSNGMRIILAVIPMIPEVGTKVLFPKERDCDVSYCRLLLRDTMRNYNNNRTWIAESPLCEHCSERETTDHFLLWCHKYSEARSVMLETIQDILMNSKFKVSVNITESLLLAPRHYQSISKKENRHTRKHCLNSSLALVEQQYLHVVYTICRYLQVMYFQWWVFTLKKYHQDCYIQIVPSFNHDCYNYMVKSFNQDCFNQFATLRVLGNKKRKRRRR